MRPQGPAHPLQPRGSFSSLLLATLHHLNKAGEWMVSVQAHVSQKVDGEVGRTSGTAGRMFRASVSSCPTMHVVYVRYVRQGDGTVHNLHLQRNPRPRPNNSRPPPCPGPLATSQNPRFSTGGAAGTQGDVSGVRRKISDVCSAAGCVAAGGVG